jgi:hypothetical protein
MMNMCIHFTNVIEVPKYIDDYNACSRIEVLILTYEELAMRNEMSVEIDSKKLIELLPSLMPSLELRKVSYAS